MTASRRSHQVLPQNLLSLLPPTGLRFLIVVLLILGIFFRFVHLDRKIYWGDESSALLRISGYSPAEVMQDLEGRIVGVEDVLKYQRTTPQTSIFDTINASAANATHPPLYFLITKWWMQLFGNSMAVTRSISALISLLAFPCIYWLCLELFNSSLVGWMAIALIAISPFHVIYAQEARMYSLWTVTILLSSAVLLWAMRTKTKVSWIIYGTTVALGIYTHLFFMFVAIGHGIYVVIIERFRLSKTFVYYLLASLASFLAFAPWLWVIIVNRSSFESATAWATQNMSLLSLVKYWLYNVSYVFIDFFFVFTYYPDSPFNWSFGKFLIPLVLSLIIYSIYLLCQRTHVRIWLFILTLIASTALAVILPDLISGGYRSIMGRYFTPCYLGIELAVAYLLTTKINSGDVNIWEHKVWKIVTFLLISGGVLSCIISSQSETWWNKRTISYDNLHGVRIINQAPNPLLITKSPPLSLSHKLDSKVKIMVVNQSNTPKIPDGFSNVFLFKHSWQKLPSGIDKEQKYKMDIAYKGRKQSLWRLSKE
ncbi:MAG: hypothetical protein F6K10_00970 [Moorea sp. SIO2B7]|nr:hypothetical protein [Moorena sp. SIO2B7]